MEKKLELGSLSCTIEGLVLPFGLTLDRVRIQAGAASGRMDPFALAMAEPAQIEIEISELSVKTFVEKKAPNKMTIEALFLDHGLISLRGSAKLVFEVKANATCALDIIDRSALHVRLVDVDKPGPIKGLIESQMDAINPIFTANDLPFDLDLESCRIEAGSIFLTATTRLQFSDRK